MTRPGTLRRPAAPRHGRPRPAVRRHRPARLPAARLGAERRRRGPGAVQPHRGRGAGRPGRRAQAAVAPSSSGSARAASPSWRRRSTEAREAGALVVMDAKRGDIGSTMAAYAAAFLDQDSPLFSDALTVSPYLGFGSLRPGAGRWPRASGCRALRAGADLQPGGRRGPARGPRGRRAPWRRRAGAPRGRERGRRAARLLRRGGRRHARRSVGRATSRSTARSSPPASGPRAPPRRTLPAVFGARSRNVVPSVSRGVLRHGPDVGAPAGGRGPLRGRGPGRRGAV